jgi:hypothetical protein
MASISINGSVVTGRNIHINGRRVTVDGKDMGQDFTSPLEVRVLEGVIEELRADGSVNCNNVTGSVHAGGSVNCDDVGRDVSAGGSVNCDNVGGKVAAGGSVRMG